MDHRDLQGIQGKVGVLRVVDRLRSDAGLAEELNFRTSTQILAIRDLGLWVKEGEALARELKGPAE